MRRVFAAVIASLAFAAVLSAPGAAYASVTKCASNFCAHIEGTGSHVAWVRMEITLAPDQSESATFDINTPDYPLGAHNSYYHKTKLYHFSTAADAGFTVAHFTAHYYIDRSFANDTRMCMTVFPRGNRYLHTVCGTIYT